jgi:NAD(P)-dependent dehydrogenase (short-subunit alcohol dehydrogenase family)
MASSGQTQGQGQQDKQDQAPTAGTRNTMQQPGATETPQGQPGIELDMKNKPVFIHEEYRGSGKLAGKVALVTGGDSGIGRAVAVHFAREGADVCISYLCEHDDAEQTRDLVENEGVNCLLMPGDVGDSAHCNEMVDQVIAHFGKLDILVNNAAEQHSADELEEITDEQIESTFRTNIFGYIYLIRAALPKMEMGGRIVNTSSVTAHRGSSHLVDYASTKGAIEALTKSVAPLAADRNITVNAVAPGPIWTPLIPATFKGKQLQEFGKSVLMKRPGQPWEVATCYVFLASRDGSYITGQTLHPNGGGQLGG